MKKLTVKKGSTCMACLQCVQACSEAFYKEFHEDKSCIQIVEKKSVRPMVCPQCGKCAEACPVFLTPTEIKGAHESGDNDALNALNASACIQCGLCSYVCPSRVEITEAVGKAKEAVLKANALKNARK